MTTATTTTLPPLAFGYFEDTALSTAFFGEEDGSYRAAVWCPLPDSVERRITSDPDKAVVRSWKSYGPPKADLAYVQVTHLDMKRKPTIGELVIHRDLARDVVEISRDIFSSGFPIEQQRLIDYWDADDDRSMRDNNSSALCVRPITGGSTLSQHALGRAWDINTRLNPFHKVTPTKEIIAPIEGKEFLDRTLVVPGMIKEGDAVVQAFDKRGWEWGGRWTSCVDYQHFQKKV